MATCDCPCHDHGGCAVDAAADAAETRAADLARALENEWTSVEALTVALQRARALRFKATTQPRVVAVFSDSRDAPVRQTAFAVGYEPTVGEVLDYQDGLLAELAGVGIPPQEDGS